MPVIQEDKENYIKVEIDDKKLPTIGANGSLVRRDAHGLGRGALESF